MAATNRPLILAPSRSVTVTDARAGCPGAPSVRSADGSMMTVAARTEGNWPISRLRVAIFAACQRRSFCWPVCQMPSSPAACSSAAA